MTERTDFKRIGLFGGTFDPVHYGHLRPALELSQRYALDVLHMLPNHLPAHRGTTGAKSQQRIDMLHIATRDVARLAVDEREARRDRPTYTIETLEELHSEHPGASLIFFLGADAFANFQNWHRWQDIIKLANLVVIDRPNAQLGDWAEALLADMATKPGNDTLSKIKGMIVRQQVTQLAISATDIRAQIGRGESIRFLLPDAVREYIDAHRLYR